MNHERIHRQERRRKHLLIKWLIAVALLLALSALIYLKFKQPVVSQKQTQEATAKILPPANFRAIADSIVISCYQGFGISDSMHAPSNSSQDQEISASQYHQFGQNWPEELPLITFAQRLSIRASEKEFSCDCSESQKSGLLDCKLISGKMIAARIKVKTDHSTKLASREIAIVIDNFGALKKDEIISLIKAGYTFGYLATIEMPVSEELRKLFVRANITPIAILPASTEGWKALASRYRLIKGAGKVRKESPFAFDKSMVSDALDRLPETRAFTLNLAGNYSLSVIKTVFDEARRARLPYVPNTNKSISLDSLALAKKLSIIPLSLNDGDTAKSYSEMRLELISWMVAENAPRQRIYILDGNRIDIDSMLRLKELLNGLGIRVRPLPKMAKAP